MGDVTIWCDKDGVLAEYDYSIYEPENGAPAPWTIRNAHVFKNLDPYENMVKAFKYLYVQNMNKSMYKREMSLRVLTSVSDGLTLSEQVLDGMEWCRKYIGLRPRDFYATAIPKEDIPLSLRNELTAKDVLLDDYMPNLIKWREHGGTAVKVINGINSTTEDFPYFYNHVDPGYIIAVLRTIVTKLDKGDTLSDFQLGPHVTVVEECRKEYEEYAKRNQNRTNSNS